MAYDSELADRVRALLEGTAGYSERRMFGGICFMLNGNMCCGVTKDRLMLRLGDAGARAALRERHVKPMDFTGRPMRGMVFVGPGGHAADTDLKRWVRQSAAFAGTLPPKAARKARPSRR